MGAQWFEDHSPVDPRFRKPEVKGVTANVICAAMLGGEEYPASAIGINLPNANWIRQEYGSKSVTIGNLTEAYNKAAQGNGFRNEFVIRPVESNLYVLVEKNGCTGPRLRPSGGRLRIMTGAADFLTVLLCGWEQICSGRRKK